MPRYDKRCIECEHTFEFIGKAVHEPPSCPNCGGGSKTVWLPGGFPNCERGKEPYDMLHGPIPDSKRIFSGPKASSKTTT